jgi:hypothetical protein
VALDPSGTVAATADAQGVRVGRVAGGEPHRLLGHDRWVKSVAVSPDLRWVATIGEDRTLRLWPMPDLSKPPLHRLPHDELMAKLRALTNLQVVEDAASPTGYKLDIGPFPGVEGRADVVEQGCAVTAQGAPSGRIAQTLPFANTGSRSNGSAERRGEPWERQEAQNT